MTDSYNITDSFSDIEAPTSLDSAISTLDDAPDYYGNLRDDSDMSGINGQSAATGNSDDITGFFDSDRSTSEESSQEASEESSQEASEESSQEASNDSEHYNAENIFDAAMEGSETPNENAGNSFDNTSETASTRGFDPSAPISFKRADIGGAGEDMDTEPVYIFGGAEALFNPSGRAMVIGGLDSDEEEPESYFIGGRSSGPRTCNIMGRIINDSRPRTMSANSNLYNSYDIEITNAFKTS